MRKYSLLPLSFFDIETTGFSPAHTSLYLIGCAYHIEQMLYIKQFFAETPEEEKEVLEQFLLLLDGFDTIITFNGIGFDIPYLKAKCNTYECNEHFADFTYVDIFKSISQIKHILQLPNYKQKTIEAFLGIGRDDLYSGGELIEIYHSYTKEPRPDKLEILLLHNYEDVLDMPALLPSYPMSICFTDSIYPAVLLFLNIQIISNRKRKN